MTTTNKLSELQAMIRGTIDAHQVNRNRQRALRAIQWRLRGPNGEFVGLGVLSDGLPCIFCPESSAMVFDGRDNETIKLATYERALGPLTVEIIPQLCRA